MRRIDFYKTITGVSPVEELLGTLSDAQTQKIMWVMKLVRELNPVPSQYFTKHVNTDDIRLSTLRNIAMTLGKHIEVRVA